MARWVVPLLVDKLSAAAPEVRVDALVTLAHVTPAYGAQALLALGYACVPLRLVLPPFLLSHASVDALSFVYASLLCPAPLRPDRVLAAAEVPAAASSLPAGAAAALVVVVGKALPPRPQAAAVAAAAAAAAAAVTVTGRFRPVTMPKRRTRTSPSLWRCATCGCGSRRRRCTRPSRR